MSNSDIQLNLNVHKVRGQINDIFQNKTAPIGGRHWMTTRRFTRLGLGERRLRRPATSYRGVEELCDVVENLDNERVRCVKKKDKGSARRTETDESRIHELGRLVYQLRQ